MSVIRFVNGVSSCAMVVTLLMEHNCPIPWRKSSIEPCVHRFIPSFILKTWAKHTGCTVGDLQCHNLALTTSFTFPLHCISSLLQTVSLFRPVQPRQLKSTTSWYRRSSAGVRQLAGEEGEATRQVSVSALVLLLVGLRSRMSYVQVCVCVCVVRCGSCLLSNAFITSGQQTDSTEASAYGTFSRLAVCTSSIANRVFTLISMQMKCEVWRELDGELARGSHCYLMQICRVEMIDALFERGVPHQFSCRSLQGHFCSKRFSFLFAMQTDPAIANLKPIKCKIWFHIQCPIYLHTLQIKSPLNCKSAT